MHALCVAQGVAAASWEVRRWVVEGCDTVIGAADRPQLRLQRRAVLLAVQPLLLLSAEVSVHKEEGCDG